MAASSCMKDSGAAAEHVRPGEIVLSIQQSEVATKTTSPGLDAYGENTVSSITLFVWPAGQEDRVCAFRAADIPVQSGSARSFIPGDVLSRVADASGATVVVTANADSPAAGSLSQVLSSLTTASFQTEGAPDRMPMYGQGTASLSADGLSLTGSVSLKRSAAKLEIRIVDIASSIEEGSGNFIPDTDHMQITLHNALKRGPVGGVSHIASAPADADFFNLACGPLVAPAGQSYFTTANPFYTFASNWNSDESMAMSFLLTVPWSSDGGVSWQKSYYQIPIAAEALKVQDNTHYIINMRIGIVGSFEEELPVELTPSAIVIPWVNFDMEDSEIVESRYLVVSSKEVSLNNQTETTIEFASSHTCIISSKALTRSVLSSESQQTETIDESQYTLTIDNSTGIISFQHTLDNSGSSEADFAPYECVFVVRHEDNTNYAREIKITQHPMISVIAQENSDGTTSAHVGYTYINNGTKSSYGAGGNGLTGSNKNPNMYIITVTSFTDGNDYTIGDPRTTRIDNIPTVSNNRLTYTWSANVRDMDGNTRRLSYYHPTEKGDRTLKMVAPQFRVASSYGACQTASYDNMRRRCASYQEDGYPAGRWRMPTAAEIQYIISLSAQGTIPELFTIKSGGNGYWCANGWVGGNANNEPVFTLNDYSGSHSVRCVYDEWYWGSGQLSDKTAFTWGDKEVF